MRFCAILFVCFVAFGLSRVSFSTAQTQLKTNTPTSFQSGILHINTNLEGAFFNNPDWQPGYVSDSVPFTITNTGNVPVVVSIKTMNLADLSGSGLLGVIKMEIIRSATTICNETIVSLETTRCVIKDTLAAGQSDTVQARITWPASGVNPAFQGVTVNFDVSWQGTSS